MSQSKAELRQQLKTARLELTDAEHTRLSRQIIDNLKAAADWSQIKTVHYFEPLKELLEPDISGFVVWLEDNYPDIQLFAPRQIEGQWEMISIKDQQPPAEFDVVLVPMLGFDPQTLHRIGYGGGYYDKFLATQPHAQKIGVCFALGKTENLPTEPHDIPLDVIITK